MKDEFLKLVTSRQNGRLDAETLLRSSEELLAGTPVYPPETVMTLGMAAADVLDSSPGMAIDTALKLLSSTEREVRAVTAAMVFRFARYQPGFWVDTIRHLATDEDWEVRDLAAHSFDTTEFGEGAAEFHLEFVLDVLREWVGATDYLLRRAATQALLGYSARHPEFRTQYLELLNPLLDDPSEYVRDNLAAALRKIGRTDSALVMDYIARSVDAAGPPARDMFRELLGQPFAAKLPELKAALSEKLNPKAG